MDKEELGFSNKEMAGVLLLGGLAFAGYIVWQIVKRKKQEESLAMTMNDMAKANVPMEFLPSKKKKK